MASFRCTSDEHRNERFNDNGVKTQTSEQQVGVEESVAKLYDEFREKLINDPSGPVLRKDAHITFLKKGLLTLSDAYECLDASRPWLCYWILHSLDLLNERVADEVTSNVVKFLNKCQHPDGGFGGGPHQIAHLAPTYAAVNALCVLATEEAYKAIDRDKLYDFLKRLKTPEGGFQMHEMGEVDIRGVYCAIAVARLTNIYTDELFDGCAEWVIACQTFEGGFGGTPGMEAHGGYSFCGFAALVLLGKEHLADIKALLRWTVNRQMRFEGGFQGRTNKLVDGCYSFWQGGIFPMLHRALSKISPNAMDMKKWLFHQEALQEYLLICCQSCNGGLIDKPGKSKDFYHTCYTLSGLSIAQHFGGGNIGSDLVIGNIFNELLPVHPVYNICVDSVVSAYEYFKQQQVPGKGSSTRNDARIS